ncbi:MAG: M28 family peptidase [Candidatus Zixiibacteriota bacterium]
MRSVLMVCLLVLCLCPAVLADDVYEVYIESPEDARLVNQLGVQPLFLTDNGYIVSSRGDDRMFLSQSGLHIVDIAENISIDELAFDIRRDDYNSRRFDWLYESGGLRIALVDSEFWMNRTSQDGMSPVRILSGGIQYRADEIEPVIAGTKALVPDLDGIMALVNQDSLESYTSILQAFDGRVAGTAKNALARDWIASEFVSFGYDSVVIDSFVASLAGTPTNCQNVIAYKLGTVMPDVHIVIGAHRDAVQNSPGADDNGSGTAGVLELARIFKDVDTDVTLVFALFDAEEWGLFGSYHYANEAVASGENIIYMFNMDMIGHYENTDRANLFHGSILDKTLLCQHLADSLLGMNAAPAGNSGGSDHYPFQQQGFEVTFLAEYIFSSVYHSSHDSTSNMSFDYMHDMVKLGAATVYAVDFQHIPDPALRISIDGGAPIVLAAGATNTLTVTVSGENGGVPVGGEASLHYSVDGGAMVEVGLTSIGGDQYSVDMPELPCGSVIDFYVTAEEATYGTYYDVNTSEPHHAIYLYYDGAILVDDFNSDLGWVVSSAATDGDWERDIPMTGIYSAAPQADFDGSGYCYLTDNSGSYQDVDGGSVMLESPVFDISGGYAVVSFAYWFFASPTADKFDIQISNNGGMAYSAVDTKTYRTTADYGWKTESFLSTDIVTGTSNMRVKFSASDLGGATTVEAAVDAFRVDLYHSDPFSIVEDAMPEGTAGHPYSMQLNDANGIGEVVWIDMSGGLAGTGLTLSEDGVISGTPTAAETIVFTAWAGDQMLNFDDYEFTIVINAPVSIDQAAGVLPQAIVGEAYSYQFTGTGGTGGLDWGVIVGSFDGTGLSFSTDGLLSGTPEAEFDMSFTIRATDNIGAYDERGYSLISEIEYVFGDANGDGTVNVGDAVFLIQYIFRGGAAPDPEEAGDANCDGSLNVGDAVYIIQYIFAGGPEPNCD